MKPRFLLLFLFIILVSFLSIGCTVINISSSSLDATPPSVAVGALRTAPPTQRTVSDYFPFVPNRTAVYRGVGSEYAAFTAYSDYIFDNRIQMRFNNGGTETIKIFEVSEGKLILILSQSEVYYKPDYLNAYTFEGEVLLKEPLIAGNTWPLKDGGTRSITAVDMPVTTPYGDFSALEVTTEYPDSVMRDYYAQNTGLIMSVFESGGTTVQIELEKIIFNNAYSFYPTVYFPEMIETDIIISSLQKQIHLFTNEDIDSYFEQFFISQNMMSKNTRIRSLRPVDLSGAACIDFSREFITEMNAGAAMETAILQSVANTVGAYFMTDCVVITIEGENYSSGHIYMEDGEWFETDF